MKSAKRITPESPPYIADKFFYKDFVLPEFGFIITKTSILTIFIWSTIMPILLYYNFSDFLCFYIDFLVL